MKYFLIPMVLAIAFIVGVHKTKLVKRKPIPVVLMMDNYSQTWMGTAFQVQTDHGPVLITNKHICGNDGIKFVHVGGQMRKIAIVLFTSNRYDLCVLSPIKGIPALPLAEDYKYKEQVHVHGYPLGVYSYSEGEVGQYRYGMMEADVKLPPQVFVTFTGEVNSGNSGSPVLNINEEVIGVISVKFEGHPNVPGLGGFMPLEALRNFLQDAGYLNK